MDGVFLWCFHWDVPTEGMIIKANAAFTLTIVDHSLVIYSFSCEKLVSSKLSSKQASEQASSHIIMYNNCCIIYVIITTYGMNDDKTL